MPKALANEPVLFSDLEDIAEAFFVLNSGRVMNDQSINFISLTEIKSYIEIYDVEDIERFVRLVRCADSVYVKAVSKITNSKLNNGSKAIGNYRR